MAATELLHLILLGLTWDWPAPHTVLLLAATLLWLAIIVFSLVGPVPINDRVKSWDLQIALAFLALILSYKTLVMN